MTKQATTGIFPAASDDPPGAGAPANPGQDQNALLRSPPPRGSSVDLEPSEGASPPERYQEPVVSVLVSGVRLDVPKSALNDGLTHLRLASEAHVRVEDYATAVGLVLEALANRGMIIFLV